MMEKKTYQFTQVPTNLFILLDNNCRSMLFTLIQLSTKYDEGDGWFFRTYADLEEQSNLSTNLVMATIQTLFNEHLIEARPTGYGKGKKPNYYKVNFDEFVKYEQRSIEDCIKNPDLKIRTANYKGSNFKLNLVRETVNNTVNNSVKSENNIDNVDNKENKDNIENVKKGLFNGNIIGEKTKKFKTECKEDFEEALKSTEEKKTVSNDFFNDFKNKVDSNLVGDNDNELLDRKAEIIRKLEPMRIEIGSSTYQRCKSYLNRKYQEASASIV